MDEQQSEQKQDLFERLRAIRIEKGIELEEIAKKTKIQLRYLEAMESGNSEDIPFIYDTLFFKSYLTYLELEDEQEYLDEFQDLHLQRQPQHTTTIRRVRVEKANRRKTGLLKAVYITAPLVVVAIVILILAINSMNVEEGPSGEISEVTVQQIVEQMVVADSVANEDSSVAEISDSLTTEVVLSAVARTWIRVIQDEKDTSEYMLRAEEKLSLRADSVFQFIIGNAGGVDFNVNGTSEGILGSANEVITNLRITSAGIVAKQIKQVELKEESNDTLATD